MVINNLEYGLKSKCAYEITKNIIDELSEKVNLNVEFVKDFNSNIIYPKNDNNDIPNILFSSLNPLKLIDFLKGYECAYNRFSCSIL